MTTPTPRQRLTGLLATLAVLGILIALPIVLVAIGANPIPDPPVTLGRVTDAFLAPDDGSLVLGLLTVVAWLAWAVMAVTLLVEVVARIRRVPAPHLLGLGRPQAAARGLIAVAALLFVATPLVTQTTAPATATPPASVAQPVAYPRGSQAVASPEIHDSTQPGSDVQKAPRQKGPRHAVRAGDSLWGIAAQYLGDGSRYPEIVDLNRHLIGARPSFLEPGWVLELPAPVGNTNQTPYTVRPGDTLTAIAHEQLGDADRYLEIYNASTATTQPGGAHLADPDLIDVGWTLTIPGHNTPTPTRSEPRPPTVDAPRTPTPYDAPPSPVAPPQSDPPATSIAPATPQTQPADPEGSSALATDLTPIEDQDDSVLDAPWILAGLTGGGVLLSGALLTALRTRRQTASRYRRPGRAIAAPPPDLASVEMTLNATGATATTTVEFTNQALRRLAATVAATGTAMPPLAAVELSTESITLHLSAPAGLSAPWVGSPDETHWHLATDTEVHDIGPDTDDIESPYPLLVTIGTSDAGETWLLNVEELAPLTISGDPTRARDFARHLAAQLAVNPWSRRVRLDCVGVAEECAVMDERITYHPTGRAGTDATAHILAAAVTTIDRATRHHTDVSTARTGTVDDDAWPAQMLLLDADAGDPPDLDQLLHLVEDHVGQSATAVLVTGERPNTPGAALHLTDTGRVLLTHADLDLIAVGLTSDEAHGCALIYAQSDTTDDVAVSVDESVTDGWERYADSSGALRHDYTLPRGTPDADSEEPPRSLLEGDDEDYLRAGAIVQDDLDRLAPKVPAGVRVDVEAKDPSLDDDVVDWFATECRRPRLSLLGPVAAQAHGKALAKRRPYFTELLAFLALHRKHGATREEIGEAFDITAGKVRDYTNTVRDWLGSNPGTGEPHLPHADKAPATRTSGINVYQVDSGLLVDLDLFLRLRARGQARGGQDGIKDLCTALKLVGNGRPFSHLREQGWTWLANEPDRIDLMAPGWIADTALIVTTEALTAGDLATARFATHVASQADPYGESTTLCLAHVTGAEGDQREAERIVREDICARSDDGEAPMDLPERTTTILRTHSWLAS